MEVRTTTPTSTALIQQTISLVPLSNSSLRRQNRVQQAIQSLELVYDKKTIKQAVTSIAQKIYEKHGNNPDVVLVTTLKGGDYFGHDIKKALGKLGWYGFQEDYVYYSSYGNELSSGEMNVKLQLNTNPTGKTIILLDDLVETGKTLAYIVADIKKKGAALVETAVLIDKIEHHSPALTPTYSAFELKGNHWLVGYGLDQEGFARNFSHIGALLDEAKNTYLQQCKQDKQMDLAEQNSSLNMHR